MIRVYKYMIQCMFNISHDKKFFQEGKVYTVTAFPDIVEKNISNNMIIICDKWQGTT